MRRRALRAGLAVVIVSGGCAAFGDARSFLGDVRGHLTIAGVRVGTTSLAEVSGRWGAAPVSRLGDAGSALAIVCYATQGPDAERLLLAASPLGGSRQVITNVALAYDGAAPCLPATNERDQRLTAFQVGCTGIEGHPFETGGGIVLGMLRDEAERILGTPAERGSIASTYLLSERANGGDVTAELELCFRDGRLAELHGSYLETF